MEPLLVRPEQAAKALGLSRGRVYELLGRGEIESIKDGAARLIPTESLRSWVDRRRAATTEQSPTPEPPRAA